MTTLRLSIPGDPVPKGRPRLGRHGNVYTPAATLLAEERIGWEFKRAYPGHEPLAVPLAVELTFRCGPVERHKNGRFKRQAPDADNLAKLCCDALNGVAWDDDARIDWLTVGVVRDSADPGTDVTIRPLLVRVGE